MQTRPLPSPNLASRFCFKTQRHRFLNPIAVIHHILSAPLEYLAKSATWDCLFPGTDFAADKKDDAQPETRKVCVDVQGKDGKPVMDPKTNKPKQQCKEVKAHQKHEATKIEDAKKEVKK